MPSIERGSRLYGAMVIALAEGERLGRVSDVFIDTQAAKILGISCKSGIWGGDEEVYFDFADIQKFSRDVVIVSAQAAGKDRPEEAARWTLKALRGYKVTSQAGKHIGELADLQFNREDGSIVDIILTENRRLAVNAADVRIGPDLILVPADAEAAVTRMEPEPNEFMTRVFGTANVSETVRESFEGLRTSMRNNVDTEKLVQRVRTGSLKARDTVLRSSQAFQAAINRIRARKEAEETTREDQSHGGTPADATGRPDAAQEPGPAPSPQDESEKPPK